MFASVCGKSSRDEGAAFVAGSAVVGEDSLIGMHATLLNGCKVGRGCIIGAGTLVPEGKVIPDGSVAVGVPARVVKDVSPEQLAASKYNAEAYAKLGAQHAAAQFSQTAKSEE